MDLLDFLIKYLITFMEKIINLLVFLGEYLYLMKFIGKIINLLEFLVGVFIFNEIYGKNY